MKTLSLLNPHGVVVLPKAKSIEVSFAEGGNSSVVIAKTRDELVLILDKYTKEEFKHFLDEDIDLSLDGDLLSFSSSYARNKKTVIVCAFGFEDLGPLDLMFIDLIDFKRGDFEISVAKRELFKELFAV